MKRSNLVLVSGLFTLNLLAFAITMPNWERPILGGDMKKIEARFEFEDASGITLELTKRDGSTTPTGLRLNYLFAPKCTERGELCGLKPEKKEYFLTIQEIRDAGCGSREYIANFRHAGTIGGERVTIVLTDHTNRVCKDFIPYRWEAKVRKGAGWCGTMDSTMTMVGNPDYIATIQ